MPSKTIPCYNCAALRYREKCCSNCWQKNGHCRVLINSSLIKNHLPDGCDGVHLNATDLSNPPAWLSRLQSNPGIIIGASCHNSEELKTAQQLGVDFVTLSPVAATRSHPDAQTLGWENFAELAQLHPLAVYALGGVSRKQLSLAQQHGAIGVAGISDFWPASKK